MSNWIRGIDHIQLAAPKGCEDEARRFYGELLGMEEVPKPENLRARGGCWFQCGRQEIHIGIQDSFLPAKKAHPGLVVTNLADFMKHLLNQDVDVKEGEPIQGRMRMFVDDPWGNRLEFLEYNE
ncbi:VOC family protein [Bacillus sp. 2205SS5-2]|uniref:VOC family protein n=1 Tax=Bacillus sp. 2205SS5-2 TaxID=3109031 RepID=UPI003005E61E